MRARAYSEEVPIAAFRAMFMNKPARAGTLLPWHQDRWSYLDRDPLLTVWTALDPATQANDCVQVIPGSHRLGLLNPEHASGFLSAQSIAKHAPDEASSSSSCKRARMFCCTTGSRTAATATRRTSRAGRLACATWTRARR